VVSVVLPTYNERDNIRALITDLLACVPEPLEVLVVDDDSPDGTWQVVREMQATEPRVRVLRRLGERGLASAIADGIAASRGDIVVWMDCDFSMPPATVPQLLAALRNADLAFGTRYAPGGADARESWLRSLPSWGLNLLATVILDSALRVEDYTSGFIAVRREVLDRVPILRQAVYGEYFIPLLHGAKRQGLRIARVPYHNVPRRQGKSKAETNLARLGELGWAYLKTLLGLRFGSSESRLEKFG